MQTQGERARESTTSGLPSLSRVHAYLSSRPAEFLRLPSRDEEEAERNNEANRNGLIVGIANAVDEIRCVLSILRSATEEEADEEELYHQILSNSQPQRDDESSSAYVFRDCRGNALALATFLAGNRAPESTMEHPFAENRRTFTKHISSRLQQLFQQNYDNTTTSTTTSNIHNLRWGGHMIMHATHSTGGADVAVESVEEADVSVPPSASSSSSPSTCRGVIIKSWSSWKAARYFHRHVERLYRLCTFFGLPTCVQPLCAELCVVSGFPVSIIEIPQGPIRMAVGEMLATTAKHTTGRNSQPTTTNSSSSFFVDEVRQLFEGMRGKRSAGCRLTAADYELWMNTSASQVTVVPTVAGCLDCYSVQPGGADEDDLLLSLLQSVWSPSCILPPVGFPNVKVKPSVGVPPLPSLSSSSWLIVSQKLFHNCIRSVVAAFADLSERQESLLRVAPWFVRDVFHSRGLRLLCLRLVRRLLISELQSRGCRFVAFVHKLTTEATSRAMKRLCLSALRNRRTADIDMDPEPLLKDATRHDAVVPMLLNKLISRFLTKPSFITDTLWPKIVAMFPSFGGELEMNPHRYSVLGGTAGGSGGGALLQSSSSVTANNYHRGAASIMLLFGSGGFTSPSGTFGTFGRQVGSMPSSVANSDLVPPQLHSASSPPPPPPVSASAVEDPSEFDFAKVSLPDVLSYLSSALGVAFSSSTKQFHSSLHAVIVVPILNSPTACALRLGYFYPMQRDLDPVVVSMETESAAMQQLLAAESCECIAACPTSMLLLRNAWRMGCSQTRSELQRVTSFDVLTHDSSMPHHLQEGKPARLAVGFLRRGLLAESSAATVMLVEDSLKRLSPRVALRYPSTDLPPLPQPSMSLRDWVSEGPVFMSVFQEVLWSHSAERGSSSVALATQFRDHDTTSNLCLCDVLALWLLRTLPFSRVVHNGVSSPPLISPASIGATRWSSACLPSLTLERALSGPSSIATHSHVSREIMQPTPCLWALSTDQCLSSIDHLLAGMESVVSSSSYGVSLETLHMSLSVMLDAVLFTMDTLSLLQQPAATVEKKKEEEPVFAAALSGASTRLVRLLCILGGGLRVAIRRSSVSTFEVRSLHCFGRLVQPWLNEKEMTVASVSMPSDGDSPSLPQPFPAVLFLSCLWLLGPLTGSGFSLKISSEIAAAWLKVIEDDPETFIEDPNRSICDFESQILHNEDWLRSIHAACMSYLNVARDVKGDDQSIVVHATTTSSTNGRTLPRKVSNTKKMNSNRRSQEDECNERRAAAHEAHVRAICSFLLKRMEKSETAAELLSDVEVVTYPLHRADRERRQVPADVMMTLVGSPSAVSVDPTSVQRERETMSPQRHRPSGGDSNVTILRRVPSVFSVGGDVEVSSPEKASPQQQQVLMVHTNEEARRRLEQSVQKRRMSVGLAFANLDGSPEKEAPMLPPAEPGTQTAMSASKLTGPSNIITNGNNNTASSAVNRAAALRQQKTRDIIQRTAVATSSQDAESFAVEKRRAEEELRKKEREDAKIARFLKQQQQSKKPQHVRSLEVGRCSSSMEPGSSTECPVVDTAGGVRAASTDVLLSSQRAPPGGYSSIVSPLQRVREEARVMLQALNVDGKDTPIGGRAIVVPEALAFEKRSVRASRKTLSLVPLV